MKLIKLLPLLTLSLALVGCNDHYNEGFSAGQIAGNAAGTADGDAAGYSRGQTYFQNHTTYDDGVTDGTAVGISQGYSQGYTVGVAEGKPIGFAQAVSDGTYASARSAGYTDGYGDGFDDGYDSGYDNGYDDGYDDGVYTIQGQINTAYNNGYDDGYYDGDADGYDDGYDSGFDSGYDDGFDDGYDVGYDDGWDAGLDLSVGPINSSGLTGRAGLLSKVHNDLINYSKIKAPKVTSRGIEVNGKLIFEETAMNSKDLEKRAAAIEKYLVVQMGNQIAGHFGLSQERSLQIAKVSNLWRKYATTRAVSDVDADAYTKALIGVNLKEVEKAFKESLKGDATAFNALISQAAEVNGTTPENITKIMNAVFF